MLCHSVNLGVQYLPSFVPYHNTFIAGFLLYLCMLSSISKLFTCHNTALRTNSRDFDFVIFVIVILHNCDNLHFYYED